MSDDADDAHARLQFIADHVPALVAYVDAEERYLFCNRTYVAWFGISPRDMLGRSMAEIWDPARYARVRPNVQRVLRGQQVEFESRIERKGGARTVHTTYLPDLSAEGKVRGFFILASDISKLVATRRALDNARRRLDLALEASRVTVWEADVRTGEVVLSEAWADLLERPPGETRTTVAELSALVHPQEIAELTRQSAATLKGVQAQYAVEHRVRAASGHWKWILSRGQVVERDAASGKPLRMMGTNLDITERKRGELELERLANYDTLTGAANRALFRDRVDRAIARNRRGGTRGALLCLDLDRFKGINDTLGHAAGDALLREFAARLRACVRATDTVGRLGGDEFAILLEDVGEDGAAVRIAEKILARVREPVDADGHAVAVTASIGIVEFGAGADDSVESLSKRADEALYAAKAAGRDTWRATA